MFKYKGFFGLYEYDEDDKIFHGEAVGIKDVVTFQSKSEDDIEKAFRESIDDYLDMCKKLKK